MSEERERASEDENEATQRMAADEHAVPSDATQPMSSDATQPVPLDATRAMPVADEATQQVWAARAAVPVPDAEPVSDPDAGQWEEAYAEERADRSWLRPVVIGLVVLILLGMLATGLWLILNRAGNGSSPTPAVTSTASASPTPSGTPSATATRSAPTAAAQVPVPDVVGLSEAAARQQLIANGLSVTVSRRTASGADPGTVIATEPGTGVTVPKGSQVTLVVAAAPAPTPTTPAPARPSSPAPRGSGSPSPTHT